MRNAQLFNTIADVLDLDPTLHDQERFARNTDCGTTACIAGWACILGTDDFKFKKGKWRPRRRVVNRERAAIHRAPLRPTSDPTFDDLLHSAYFSLTAASILGLSEEEGDVLFAANAGPSGDYTVSGALRAIAGGESVEDVWGDRWDQDDDEDEGQQ